MNGGVEEFRKRFEAALGRAGRAPDAVKILAVSKAQSIAKIENFLASGLPFWGLGESYLDELIEKRKHFAAKKLAWHFIGQLQSRKIPDILMNVDIVHSLSRSKELELLAKNPRDFFVQVNVSDEDSKNGCDPSGLPQLLADVKRLGLEMRCRGLMALPSPLESVGESGLRDEMRQLRKLRDKNLPHGLLNMGTSSDFEIAIEEGADVIRVGGLLFGRRA